MASLFFWRKKKPPESPDRRGGSPQLSRQRSIEPRAPEPVASLPVRRMVYALALNSPRAVDPQTATDATQTQLLLSASQTVAQIGTEPRYTPQRPSLLPQLMEAVNDEEASLRALSRVVAQDARLTGEMLRSANSAMYRVSATPVESLERAAALLGTRGIRMLISGVLMQPLASGGRTGRFGEMAWEYSMYSASAADAWAARAPGCRSLRRPDAGIAAWPGCRHRLPRDDTQAVPAASGRWIGILSACAAQAGLPGRLAEPAVRGSGCISTPEIGMRVPRDPAADRELRRGGTWRCSRCAAFRRKASESAATRATARAATPPHHSPLPKEAAAAAAA